MIAKLLERRDQMKHERMISPTTLFQILKAHPVSYS